MSVTHTHAYAHTYAYAHTHIAICTTIHCQTHQLACLEKQLANLVLSLGCSFVQWSELPEVNDVHIGPVLN